MADAPMTPTTLAAALLKDVKRHGGWHALDPVPVMYEANVLAALTAAMDPALSERAGEVLERLQKADEYEPLGHDGWDAADLITALLARIAAMEAQIKGLEGGIEAACDREAETERKLRTALAASETRAEAAEAERDALRAEADRYLRHLTTGAESLNEYKARAEAAETALVAERAKTAKLVEALKVARAHVANNADGWSVSRGAARVDLTIVDAAITEASQ